MREGHDTHAEGQCLVQSMQPRLQPETEIESWDFRIRGSRDLPSSPRTCGSAVRAHNPSTEPQAKYWHFIHYTLVARRHPQSLLLNLDDCHRKKAFCCRPHTRLPIPARHFQFRTHLPSRYRQPRPPINGYERRGQRRATIGGHNLFK